MDNIKNEFEIMEWDPIMGEKVIVASSEQEKNLHELNTAINEQLIEEFYLEKEYTLCKIAPVHVHYLLNDADLQTKKNYKRTVCMKYYEYMNYGGFNKNIIHYHCWKDVSDYIKSEVLYCLNLLNDIKLLPLSYVDNDKQWDNYKLKFANAIYMYEYNY